MAEQLLSLPKAACPGRGLQQWSGLVGCSSAQKAKSFYVTFSAANVTVFQYFELLLVSLDLRITET